MAMDSGANGGLGVREPRAGAARVLASVGRFLLVKRDDKVWAVDRAAARERLTLYRLREERDAGGIESTQQEQDTTIHVIADDNDFDRQVVYFEKDGAIVVFYVEVIAENGCHLYTSDVSYHAATATRMRALWRRHRAVNRERGGGEGGTRTKRHGRDHAIHQAAPAAA